MDPIEKAIRAALEKGDAGDRAFRERVYRSAFAALDKALMSNPSATVEAAIRKRKELQAKVTAIETEFLPAVPPVSVAVAKDDAAPENRAAPEAPPVIAVEPRPATVSNASRAADGRQEPTFANVPVAPTDAEFERDFALLPEAPVAEPPRAGQRKTDGHIDAEADRSGRKRPRRRRLLSTFIAVTVLALIGIGFWGAFQTGVLRLPNDPGFFTTPPSTLEDEDYTPRAGSPGRAETRQWISVFSPDDPTHVSAPSDAKAEAASDESGAFLRIRSGPSGSSVLFDIGQGVLEEIAGKTATFDITARAADGKATEIAVECNFAELGDCGRRRYQVGFEPGEYLFDVNLPARQPGAAGSIAINSDFSGQGGAVEIYAIRVSVSQQD